jgi:hypothetical protein
MKLSLCCAAISLFTLSAGTATQQPEDQDSCHFKVSESTTKPSITGPEDMVAMTYVIEQPDSPVEILAMDFKDSFLSVAHERVTEELRCTAKIRNRSDQSVRGVDISVLVASGGSAGGSGLAVGLVTGAGWHQARKQRSEGAEVAAPGALTTTLSTF